MTTASAALLFSAATLAFVILPCTLSAGGAGSTSVQILKADLSPRAMAMGGGFAAIADDIYAAQYNPAGLGQLTVPAASAMYYSGFEDSKVQYLSLGVPVPIRGLAGLERPVMALSAIFTQNGEFVPRAINPDDTISVGDAVNAETNRVIGFSYGEKVYSGDIKVDKYEGALEHYLGLSAKYVNSTLLEEYSASGFALDAGWLVKETKLGLAFGLSFANYGSGLKYIKDSNPMSSTARAGLAWRARTVRDHEILITHEYDRYTGEGLSGMRSGLEYNFEKMFNLRLGYKACSALGLISLKGCDMRDGNKGVTMGLGASHEGFAVDFGISLGNAVFNTTQVAFTYRFTGWDTGRPAKAPLSELVEERPKPQKSVKPAKKKAEPAKLEPVSGRKSDSLYWVD